jgi:methylthioribose-1-phosphate isomerase
MKRRAAEAFSPLFWPVRQEGGHIYVLDETLLPDKEKYIRIAGYRQACAAIKAMKTRAVGQVLLVMYTFLVESRRVPARQNLAGYIDKISGAINASRPTLSFKMLTDMVNGWVSKDMPLDACITGFLETLKKKRILQAEEAALLLSDKDTVLTHCNVSGLMPLIAGICRSQNKQVSFITTETRPYLQGSRLTAWELHRAGFPVTVIADSMAAYVMAQGMVQKVVVGADHLAQNGDIANKIGTCQIAVAAKYYRIPFYVLCPPPARSPTGNEISVEIRPDRELLYFNGCRIAPRGVRGFYPAFDITPAALITGHIHLEV